MTLNFPPSASSVIDDIPVRRLSFEELLADLPRHYAADENLFTSHLVAVLSAVFPPGEDYFVRSVRHYRNDITDPALARRVKDFIGQEAVHARAHRSMNARLKTLGYRNTTISERVARVSELHSKTWTPKVNLAIVAAYEHFTAVMGEALMSETELQHVLGHHGIRQLMLWHALEECEHKAVAFDVLQAVGFDEEHRIRIMNRVMIGFMMCLAYATLKSMAFDRRAWNPIRTIRDIRQGLRSPLFSVKVWRRLREYSQPGFHPNHINTDDLVREYRDKLFGEDGSLAPYLSGASAA